MTAYERKGIRPAKDWMTIFISGCVVLFIIICVEYYFYDGIYRNLFFTVPIGDSDQSVVIDQKAFDKVLSDINSRDEMRADFQTKKVIPPDISL